MTKLEKMDQYVATFAKEHRDAPGSTKVEIIWGHITSPVTAAINITVVIIQMNMFIAKPVYGAN